MIEAVLVIAAVALWLMLGIACHTSDPARRLALLTFTGGPDDPSPKCSELPEPRR